MKKKQAQQPVEVIEEKEIVEGDFVTIKVKMTRENLQDGQESKGINVPKSLLRR